MQGVDPAAKPFQPGAAYAQFAEMKQQQQAEEKHTMPSDVYNQNSMKYGNHTGPQPTLAHHPTSQLTANAR